MAYLCMKTIPSPGMENGVTGEGPGVRQRKKTAPSRSGLCVMVRCERRASLEP